MNEKKYCKVCGNKINALRNNLTVIRVLGELVGRR